MMNKPNFKDTLKNYFADKTEVSCAYLFGSAACGKENAYSDVDIAILYDDTVSFSEYTDRQIALIVELSQLLDRNVDIVILNRAAPYLKFQAIKEGVRIYENPARQGRAFEARSIVEYFDFLPVKNLLESSLIKRTKEA